VSEGRGRFPGMAVQTAHLAVALFPSRSRPSVVARRTTGDSPAADGRRTMQQEVVWRETSNWPFPFRTGKFCERVLRHG